jgi:antitoxin (DNA-binding transcriptional repressor) of toxin-antitoxin stability system
MIRITATQAARSFSDVLTRVSEGEEIEITRKGATVAVIAFPPRRSRLVSAERFRELMATVSFDEAFARDVAEARAVLRRPESPWRS